jgi:pimeloyl-ACP methyl ester carboxylesterase
LVVPKGSHVAPIELPDLVNAHILRFLTAQN